MAEINIKIGLVATTVGGTVDAITATFTPTVTSLTKKVFIFRAPGANTSTTPTFKADATATKTIVKKGNQALVAGDIPNSSFYGFLVYDATNDNYELLNPASDASDTIFEEAAGVITPQTLSNILRLGTASTNWGLSPLEIYSEIGQFPLFIGDGGGADGFLYIEHQAGQFQIVSTISIDFSPTNVIFITQAEGHNSTYPATTAYVDTGLATKAAKTFVENISFQDSSTGIAAQTYTLELYAQYAYTINELKIISDAGTCNAAVKINGTDVTGISAVAVSTSIATGTATAANTVAVGDKITLVISTTSGLNNLQASLKTTRI